MKQCCFCCKVTTGALLLGLVNFVLPILALVPLAGFWSQTDIDGLDFLKRNQKRLEFVLQDSLENLSWTNQDHEEIIGAFKEWFMTIVIISTLYSAVMAIFSFLMVTGVQCEVRCLMIPFLVLSMLDIVVAAAAGIVVVVALFYVSTVPGVVSLMVYILFAAFSVYSWVVVLAAYQQLGNEDYLYNPVTPVKVKHNNHEYYPSAPQHFVMEEYKDLKSSSR